MSAALCANDENVTIETRSVIFSKYAVFSSRTISQQIDGPQNANLDFAALEAIGKQRLASCVESSLKLGVVEDSAERGDIVQMIRTAELWSVVYLRDERESWYFKLIFKLDEPRKVSGPPLLITVLGSHVAGAPHIEELGPLRKVQPVIPQGKMMVPSP